MPKKSLTNFEFVSKSKEVHGDNYDYSLVNYKNNKTKVKIVCLEHGEFEQIPSNHLRGMGCRFCVYKNLESNTENFIQDSKLAHGETYIYSATSYSGCYNKLTITCKKHGDFQQKAYSHKQGRGCPKCSESKGEKEISKWLNLNNIIFIRQKKFDECKNIFPLPFDFFLPEFNICIEFDGEQHFRPLGFSGGKEGLNRTQKNDKIKNEYCKNNNINLIRIRFDENIIEELKHFLSINV